MPADQADGSHQRDASNQEVSSSPSHATPVRLWHRPRSSLGDTFISADLPHHVTQRGNRREPVFFEADDYRLYRRLIATAARRARTAVWAYCMMPNHVHLIVTPADEDGLRATFAEAHRHRNPQRSRGILSVPAHSITSSASSTNVSGSFKPRCSAVFKLMTSSKVVGCSTGRSAGLAPFRILSTKEATRRHD